MQNYQQRAENKIRELETGDAEILPRLPKNYSAEPLLRDELNAVMNRERVDVRKAVLQNVASQIHDEICIRLFGQLENHLDANCARQQKGDLNRRRKFFSHACPRDNSVRR